MASWRLGGSINFHTRFARPRDQIVARGDHVVERSKGVGVVALVAGALDRLEHRAEIEIAVAGLEMHLVPVSPGVGEPDLADAPEIQRLDEALDTLRHEVGMVGGEAKLE